jgi:CheY-like chemotaxis protein
MKKLKQILLIDDSETDNFIHHRRFDKLGMAEHVTVCTDGRQGLDYLTAPATDGRYPHPDLLFLDINMPVMDGWEFLDAYRHLPDDQRATVTVALLTTAAGEGDMERAYSYGVVDTDEAKPLTNDKLGKIMQRFFPDHVTQQLMG